MVNCRWMWQRLLVACSWNMLPSWKCTRVTSSKSGDCLFALWFDVSWFAISSFHSNFESSVQRVKYWTSSDKYASTGNSSPGNALTPSSSNAHLVGLGISMAMSGAPNALSESLSTSTGIPNLSTSQRKRIKSYLKRCRLNPRHTQLNLEGYLLLPVQRIPRYKLLVRLIFFIDWVVHCILTVP